MEYLHGRNVVHRDLKSHNIMFTLTGEVKVSSAGSGERRGKEMRREREREREREKHRTREIESAYYTHTQRESRSERKRLEAREKERERETKGERGRERERERCAPNWQLAVCDWPAPAGTPRSSNVPCGSWRSISGGIQKGEPT